MLRTKYSLAMRSVVTILGVLFISFGIACMRFSQFGTDPFVTMNIGISKYLVMDFGFIQMASNVVLLLFMLKYMRKRIHLGTVLGIFVVGYLSDFLLLFVANLPDQLIFRGLAMCVGLLSCCFGVAVYMSADLGIAPYDALGMILEQELLTKYNYKTIRIITDSCCVSVGLLLGAPVGPGTLIMAFFTGPLITFFMTAIEILLTKKVRKVRLES